jgi:glycosyltransferase involved in cell wall biosynthesis
LTRTGALPTEIDIERIGCGIFVPPDDPGAITEAIKYVRENPEKAEAMGQAGRRACETYYNIDRYAADLDKLFDCI